MRGHYIGIMPPRPDAMELIWRDWHWLDGLLHGPALIGPSIVVFRSLGTKNTRAVVAAFSILAIFYEASGDDVTTL